MTGVHDVTPAVRLRTVEDRDLDVFFDHQADPQAVEMAAFPARDKDQFAAQWAKVRADDTKVAPTIVADGMAAGNIGSWQENGQQLLGYWDRTRVLGPRRRDTGARPARGRGVDPAAVRPCRGAQRRLDPRPGKVWVSAPSRAGGEGACAQRRHRGVHLFPERIRSAQRGARRASVDANALASA